MIPPAPGRADPDWNEIWKLRQAQHETTRIADDPSHDWNRKENAVRYDRNATSGYDDRVNMTIAELEVTTRSRVLDIGAGPGTLALPLARLARDVTAVEPGAGMVAVLKAHAERDGIRNITCVQKTWEEVDPSCDLAGPYDLVIASLSLTMNDIREAIRKMEAVSRGSVHLVWFADMPFWERMYADLWEPLHGTPYYAGPTAECLFGVLCQMGIHANVRMHPLKKEYRFPTRDAMSAFFKGRFGAKTPEQGRIVDEYIASRSRMEGDEIVIAGDSTFAHIWWQTREQRI